MSRANRLRMISFAGAAVLVAACGNGPGSGVQDTPASVGVSSVGSGKPLNAKPTPAVSLSKELTGVCKAQPDPSMCGSRWMHLPWPRSRPSWPSPRASKRPSSSPAAATRRHSPSLCRSTVTISLPSNRRWPSAWPASVPKSWRACTSRTTPSQSASMLRSSSSLH